MFTYTGIPLSDCPSLLPSFSLSKSITKKEICGIPEPSSPCSVNFAGLCEGGLESCYLNIMMYDMNEEIAKQFYSKPNQTASDVTVWILWVSLIYRLNQEFVLSLQMQ